MTDPASTTAAVADQRACMAVALEADILAHAARLTAQGCPPVRDAAVRDLWAHIRRLNAPELDEHAARAVKRALDLGWRPVARHTEGQP